MVEEYIDPEFKYHQSVARVVSEILLGLGNEVLLPFNVKKYYEEIVMRYTRILFSPWRDDIVEAGLHLGMRSSFKLF